MKVMIKAIVRPEKVNAVMAALMESGYPAVTRMSVAGRGKQRGIKIGEITYDEIPKEMLISVIDEKDREFVLKIILETAKTGDKGAFGDGKIFISPVIDIYTISSGKKDIDLDEEVAS